MDGLTTMFLALIGLLILALGALGFGADSRTYSSQSETGFNR